MFVWLLFHTLKKILDGLLVRNDSILIPNRALSLRNLGSWGIMLESLVGKMGTIMDYLSMLWTVFSTSVEQLSRLQEHWTYVESLGLAKLPGEEPRSDRYHMVSSMELG